MQLNDSNAIIKIFGALLDDNELIESDQYPLNNDYFYEKLDIICYSSLFNIYQNGLRNINIQHIIEFLQTYPETLEYFNSQNGEAYLKYCQEQSENQNYGYYYDKIKKLALLRQYKLQGFDISSIYNINEEDLAKKQQMEERFNAARPEEISDYFDRIITNVNDKFIVGSRQPGVHAGHKLRELYKSFETSPPLGLGLNGDIFNTITRGARDQCLFLRSAASGVGKTRTLAGSGAQIGVGTYYDIFRQEWVTTNDPQPSLYITSEQQYPQIQSILLAFVSGVDESIIQRQEGLKPNTEEVKRIEKAIELIEKSGLYIEPIGDYGIRDLTHLTKKYKQNRGIKYLFHDYIHTSLTLLAEMAKEARIANMREDQILLMLTNTLKVKISNDLNLFTFSSTQLNRTYKTEEKMDATVIRGALSITDKLDFGGVMMNIDKTELDMLQEFVQGLPFTPTVVTHMFKNRATKYVDLKLYSHLDKATGQMLDLFVLDYNNELVQINPTRIIQK